MRPVICVSNRAREQCLVNGSLIELRQFELQIVVDVLSLAVVRNRW